MVVCVAMVVSYPLRMAYSIYAVSPGEKLIPEEVHASTVIQKKNLPIVSYVKKKYPPRPEGKGIGPSQLIVFY